MSDEDEPNFQAEESSGGDPKRKISPWQRMKWTDTMVRLLIMAVYYIGDEAGSEGTDPNKKKSSGLLQKKGKWKSVSRAMMEKGFYVSPQQCEDKFNDLNKRYKRVNDILGKGTACRVVENQGEGCSKGQIGHINDQDEEENDGKSSRKRARKGGFSFSRSSSSTQLVNQMNNEISGVFQDGGKSPWEKKQWIRNRIMQLEEQKIGYESQAFQLEKQRLKWARYSSKKEREMERAKLENERRRLENERMVLLIRKKEIELMHIQQQQQHSST
uniref:Myb/SANT-like DNA-binding domain-containing protein n=1 Tax=Medicago sativa TaxID=3879 RepID=A0AA96RD08_MEDSA|nr:hypothetical protein [Medicago sativa]